MPGSTSTRASGSEAASSCDCSSGTTVEPARWSTRTGHATDGSSPLTSISLASRRVSRAIAGRRGVAEPLGREPPRLRVGPAEPGVDRRLDERVPVAVDEAEQRLGAGAAHRGPAAGRAAEQDEAVDTLRVPRRPREREHHRVVEAEQHDRAAPAASTTASRSRSMASSDRSSTSRCERPEPRPSNWTSRTRPPSRVNARRTSGMRHSASRLENGTPGR